MKICLDAHTVGLESYPCAEYIRVTSATRKHSQSPQDFKEFSKHHYEAPHVTKVVHPAWKYERAMWPHIEPQEADQYLTAMTTSPLITIKVCFEVKAVFCSPQEQKSDEGTSNTKADHSECATHNKVQLNLSLNVPKHDL